MHPLKSTQEWTAQLKRVMRVQNCQKFVGHRKPAIFVSIAQARARFVLFFLVSQWTWNEKNKWKNKSQRRRQRRKKYSNYRSPLDCRLEVELTGGKLGSGDCECGTRPTYRRTRTNRRQTFKHPTASVCVSSLNGLEFPSSISSPTLRPDKKRKPNQIGER